MKQIYIIIAILSCLFINIPNVLALNITVESSITPDTWLSTGNILSGQFDISGITNIEKIYSVVAKFYFYADFDGFNIVNTKNGPWQFDHTDKILGIDETGDDYHFRYVDRYYEDEKETAKIFMQAQTTSVSPSASTEVTYSAGESGYDYHWDPEWFGGYDDYGKDVYQNHETKYENTFIASLSLDLFNIQLLKDYKTLPFQIYSESGDFMLNAANLKINYSVYSVPEPSSLFLIPTSLGFLFFVIRKRWLKI